MSIIPEEHRKSANSLKMSWLDRVAKDLLFAKLSKIKKGYLRVEHQD